MGNNNQPLLTVAIPTWNRASFLALTLKQLLREVSNENIYNVEVLVSDNGSSDDTKAVVDDIQNHGLEVRYIRNPENLGSDFNIAQCFNLAEGKYVLILGDDDLFVDGALVQLLNCLSLNDYGTVCMRPYGFESNFRLEYPGGAGQDIVYDDPGDFLAAIGPLMTLISSCAINKNSLVGIDAQAFCGSCLVQVHLVLRAVLVAKNNVFMNRYLMACKRNNSGGYDFSKVFVTNFGEILDSHQSLGLSVDAIRSIENRFMLGFFPFYLLKHRLANAGNLEAMLTRYRERFHGRWLFEYWLSPIMRLPCSLAILWGGGVTLIGRVISGDLRRGLAFAWSRISKGVGFR